MWKKDEGWGKNNGQPVRPTLATCAKKEFYIGARIDAFTGGSKGVRSPEEGGAVKENLEAKVSMQTLF